MDRRKFLKSVPLAGGAVGLMGFGQIDVARGALHPASRHLFSAMEASNAGPSRQWAQASDWLIKRFNSLPFWDAMDCLYVPAAESEEAARFNWKDPAQFKVTIGGAPTHQALRGWLCGVSGTDYLQTNWDPATNGVRFTQNDACLFYREMINATSDLAVSSMIGNVETLLTPRWITSSRIVARTNNTAGTILVSGNADARGFYMTYRDGASSQGVHRNAGTATTNTSASTALTTGDFFLSGTQAANCNVFNSAGLAGWGANLNPLKAELYELVEEYLRRIGAI